MTVLKVLRAQPTLFFRLSGIRVADFDTLFSTLHPIWLDREEKRLSKAEKDDLLYLMIGGTEHPIQRPVQHPKKPSKRKAGYSGKKKCHSIRPDHHRQ